MAIERIRIDYTVYAPNYEPGKGCWDLRTLQRAKRFARTLGPGARVYRNFNQTNKRGKILGDWWSGKSYWTWDGRRFQKKPDVTHRVP